VNGNGLLIVSAESGAFQGSCKGKLALKEIKSKVPTLPNKIINAFLFIVKMSISVHTY
jgi:hypothetical protein